MVISCQFCIFVVKLLLIMGIYSDYTIDFRIASYDYIENFISKKVPDWSKWNYEIGTDEIATDFANEIGKMDAKDFEFLTLHCGYIPDYYGKDSSQETLYSKLVEVLVCEWAKRVGFTHSYIQKQKSNKEDITIQLNDYVIVCDAKSFRLGRSQAAPNVKDAIKKQAYSTWLSEYNDKVQVGGLTTFPSLHDWKRGGEAYMYYTEGNPSIMILFYEIMSFILHKNITAEKLIECLNAYGQIFPSASNDKKVYWNGIISFFCPTKEERGYFDAYQQEVHKYIVEKSTHSLNKLQTMIENIKKEVEKQLSTKTQGEIFEIAKDALVDNQCRELYDQVTNIKKFRPYNKN